MFNDNGGRVGIAATSPLCLTDLNSDQVHSIRRNRYATQCMWGKHYMKNSAGTVIAGPVFQRACGK